MRRELLAFRTNHHAGSTRDGSADMGAQKKAQSRFSRVDSSAFRSTPSFHDRRQRLNYRFLAVLVAYMS